MAYTALYRKFRPATFGEMVGQEHITRTLRNQIVSGRVGHAYLFNGGRGTGKTTSAKVLARAINCLNPKDGEPCNECEICKEILNGSLTDVVEMDAASNNSVDDIRNIRDEVNFLPTKAKYRVYIIDEVHMLSQGAFNALLKTLEEPPEHVKFILATTEPQKLPTTILSRCQRFDFKKISNEDIVKRLKIICEESNIDIDEEALNLIATLSEGAMRDGISILERCMQEDDGKITADKIKELVGIPKLTYIYKIAKNIIEYNETEALQTIDEVINDGKDLNNFLWEVIKYFKDILIYSATKKLDIYSKEEVEKINNLSKNISNERLLNIIYALSNLENDIKWSSQKTIMFQVGILKVCSKVETSGIEELKKKIEELERKIESGVTIKNNVAKQVNVNIPKAPERKIEENRNNNSSVPVKEGDLGQAWNNILDMLRKSGKISLYTNLINTRATMLNDLVLEIYFPNGITPFGKSVLEKPENKNELIKAIIKETGKEVHIKYTDKKEESKPKEIENKINDLGIDINIIE